jgi:hypothetical protein
MKTKTKNKIWYKAQKLVQRLEGGQGIQVRGSGNTIGYKGDIEKDDSLYEVKSCVGDSFYLKFDTLTKASEEALAYAGRLPAVYIVMTQYGVMKLIPEWDDTTPRPVSFSLTRDGSDQIDFGNKNLLFESPRVTKGITIPKYFWEGDFHQECVVQIYDGHTWWEGWKIAGLEAMGVL